MVRVSQGNLMRQFVRFMVSGVISATTEFLALLLLVEVLTLHYFNANIIAFVLANIVNYRISRSWVFKNGKFSVRREVVAFYSFAVAGLVLNQLIMWLMVDNFNWDYKISKVVAITVVVFYNFVTKKYLVFKD